MRLHFYLVSWIFLILLVAPLASLARIYLAEPLFYWPVLLGSTLAVGFVVQKTAFIGWSKFWSHPWLLGLWLVYAFWELWWNNSVPVERFHVLLFGVLGVLMSQETDRLGQNWLLALILCGCVGIVDEFLQLLLASRVGDLRDIWLDLRASAAGIALHALLADTQKSQSNPRILLTAMAGWIGLFTCFLSESSWGHTIALPGGSFFSTFDSQKLKNFNQSKNYQQIAPATSKNTFAWKDRYYIEGLERLQNRNASLQKGLLSLAVFDNTLLETYYSPILDFHAAHWTPAMQQSVAHATPVAPKHRQSGPERTPRLIMGFALSLILVLCSLFWNKIPWIFHR